MTADFAGFPSPQRNYSHLPHAFIDAMSGITSLCEMKVVLYILRHTWGFQEFESPRRLTVDEFMHGRKRADGSRIDAGTGLTKPSVIKGLREAESHGFVIVDVDMSDPARVKKFYSLAMEGSKSFTPGVKLFDPRGKEVLPRTEKETLENNLESKTDRAHAHAHETDPESTRPTIYALYESVTGLPIDARTRDQLLEAVATYPESWIAAAFEVAKDRRARRWAYIDAILKGWQAHGFGWKPGDKPASAPKPRTSVGTPNGASDGSSLQAPPMLTSPFNRREE
ncbi:MAG: DnaD domain protein [Anaerolineae bacterium]|nr:DnaD domain protein [Anaerolineae bacterium]NUQ05959.1 DnaD domain protein [Anaerolineae bacterium]